MATAIHGRIELLETDVENHERLKLLSGLYAYNRWLYERVRCFIHGRVCEVGCGTGNILQFLLNQEEIVGIEPFHNSTSIAGERFECHQNVSIVNTYIEDCPNSQVPEGYFDTVLSLNMLEHIEDDQAAVEGMARICKPGGHVVALVPAHQLAFGNLDRATGHFRRYGRRRLRQIFENAGLQITKCFHMNLLGLLGWVWYGRIIGRSTLPVASARRFDRLVPMIDAFERIVPPPIGQSVVVNAVRP